MSTKKEIILNELRIKYERKFGRSEEAKRWIESELDKLSKKEKLTLEKDLAEIENRLNVKSRTNTRNNSFDLGQDRIKSRDQSRRSSITPLRTFKGDNLNNSVLLPNQPQRSKLSMETSFYENNLQNTSPFTRKILKKYDNLSFQDISKGFPTVETPHTRLKTEEDYQDKTSVSPLKYRRPSREISLTKEHYYQANIWKKIQDHQVQQFHKEQQLKEERNQKEKQDWNTFLAQQAKHKIDKELEAIKKAKEIEKEMIAKGLKEQRELIEKEKAHRNYIRGHERKNIDYAHEKTVKWQESSQTDKKNESETIAKSIQAHQKYLEDQKLEVLLRKKEYAKWQDELVAKKHEKHEKLRQMDKKEEEIYQAHIDRTLKQNEDVVVDLYEKIRDKTRKQQEYLDRRGFDNLRRYRRIEEEKDINGLSFLNTEEKSFEAHLKKRADVKGVLQEQLHKQVMDKLNRDNAKRDYVKGQADLWKNEEQAMQMREKIENHGEKLKKTLLRQELDKQMEERQKFKRDFSDAEILINKAILKEIGYPINIPSPTKSTDSS